jgi:hypothetical protein
MTNEEKNLEQRFGKQSPFLMPEGYFDDFTSRLMEQLPERKPKKVKLSLSIWKKYRPAMLAVACSCAAIFSIAVYLHTGNTNEKQMVSERMMKVQVKSSEEGFIEQAADYSMLDNDDIYAYVSGN